MGSLNSAFKKTGLELPRRVVVMGLGRFGGGVGVSRWLAQQGLQAGSFETAFGADDDEATPAAGDAAAAA